MGVLRESRTSRSFHLLFVLLLAHQGCSAFDEDLLSSTPIASDGGGPDDSASGAPEGGSGGALGRGGSGSTAGHAGSLAPGRSGSGGTAVRAGSGGAASDGGAPLSAGGCSAADDCMLDHAEATCNAGDCEIGACSEGFLDCDGVPDTGCEIDRQRDALHCGSCDTDCGALANTADERCTGGACEIVGCTAGFASCDDDDATGCETSILAIANCGGCTSRSENEPCTGLPHTQDSSCPAGTCQIDDCDSGWADCDATASNGCEHDSALGSCTTKLKRITIDPGFVDAVLTNFPVLVRISGDADLTSSRADGRDLYFATDGGPAGGPSALPFEIVSWNAGSGDLIAWVRVPTVSDVAGTVFYLNYGDGVDHSSANMSTAVWDVDFESVHHFDAGSLLDATANDTDGSNHGSTDDPAGRILGARAFTPNAYLDMGSGVLPNEPSYTLSAWVKAARRGGDSDCKYIMDASRASLPYEGSALGIQSTSGAICAHVNGSFRFSGSNFAADNAYSFVAIRYLIQGSGGRVETSLDGQPFETLYSGDTTDAANLSNSPFQVGRWSGGMNFYFQGSVDELRVSSIARSNAWIRAEYENQRAGSTFMTVNNP